MTQHPQEPSREDVLVYSEQVDLAYQQGLLAMSINPFVALGLLAAQWNEVDHTLALGWYTVLMVTTGARIALVVRYRAVAPEGSDARIWGKRHILSSLVGGIVWGLGAIVLYPESSFAHQLLLLMWLLGIVSSMIVSFSIIEESFYAVLFPLMAMMMTRVAWSRDRMHTYICIAAALFTVITTLYMRRIHTTMVRSLRLRFANNELIRDLERSRTLLSSTLESTADGIIAITRTGEVISYNRKLLEMWGAQPSALEGGFAMHRVHALAKQVRNPSALLRRMRKGAQTTPETPSVELLELNDGRFFEMHTLAQRSEGVTTGWVFSFRDVTTTKRNEERIRHLALHDPLTGLANRHLFEEHLRHAIAKARRTKESIGLMFLDLDSFKPINDVHGHQVGDAVLQETARRLRTCLRESDSLARIGGDEFVVIAHGAKDQAALETVSAKILSTVATPMDVLGRTCSVGVSVGISLYPLHGEDPETLLSRADAAMYAAKQAGKNQLRFAT